MTPLDARDTLLVELHRIIADTAAEAAAKFGAPPPQAPPHMVAPARNESVPGLTASIRELMTAIVHYPPTGATGPAMTTEEVSAISSLQLSDAARSAVAKLIADANAATLFRFFCLIDGVADPELVDSPTWSGASLLARQPDNEMLHDLLYECYWAYQARLAERDS